MNKILSTNISFDSQSKSLLKKALLCRTGEFDGMNGPVVVTKEMLELICDKYLSDKKTPTNENDFVPILLDHNRSVDLVKGRLLAEGMRVEEWKEIDGLMTFGLFGNLRLDDPDAQKNVETGKYAQLSISFNEETGELFEVSFVAVEAARGSIVLSQKYGGNRMSTKSLTQLKAKHSALKNAVGENRLRRKQKINELMAKAEKIKSTLVALQERSHNISLSVKKGQIKGMFKTLVTAGKISPVEFKKLDLKNLSALDEKSFAMVLSAYETRPVSSDVFQYGQKAEKRPQIDLTPKAMREAISLQKAGKGTKLSMLEKEEEVEEEKKLAEDEGEEKEVESMSSEDLKACLEEMTSHHSKLSECMEKMKEVASAMKSLADDEDKDEEKELAEEDEAKEKEKDKEQEGEE